jgi:cell division septation protein DedD
MELGFMDSTVDVPIILTDAYSTKIADAIAEVVIEKSGATKKKRTLYRVQVGAFSKEAYAEEMLKKLKAAGFEGYITTL